MILKTHLINLDIRQSALKATFDGFTKMHKKCKITYLFNKSTESSKNGHDFKSPGQNGTSKKKKLAKSFFKQDKENALSALIEKVRNMYEVPGNWKLKQFFPFKFIYKTLVGLAHYKITRREASPEEEKISLKDSLQAFFTKTFGMESLTDKKIRDFMITMLSFQNIPKIAIFMRFFGLSFNSPYSLSEQRFYLRAFEFLILNSKGIEPRVDYNKGTTYVGYRQIVEAIKNIVSYRLDVKTTEILYQDIKKLKKSDSKGIWKEGMVEFDAFMSKGLSCLKICLERSRGIL